MAKKKKKQAKIIKAKKKTNSTAKKKSTKKKTTTKKSTKKTGKKKASKKKKKRRTPTQMKKDGHVSRMDKAKLHWKKRMEEWYEKDINDPKNPPWRPTKYEGFETDRLAYQFLADGYSLEALQGVLRIHVDTIYDWCDPDSPRFKQSFSEAVAAGLAVGRIFWETVGHDMIKDKETFVKGHDLYRGNATIWKFNMANRYGWRDKAENKIATPDGGLELVIKDASEVFKKNGGADSDDEAEDSMGEAS